MSLGIHKIAMIDSEGGYGIGGYTHELSEGLAANGVEVDVYANSKSEFYRLGLPRHHRVFPVLGGALYKQRHALNDSTFTSAPQAKLSVVPNPDTSPVIRCLQNIRSRLRGLILPAEFAVCLKHRKYDLVWRQWGGDVYDNRFSLACRSLGVRVVHTVHNVLPHEETPGDVSACRRLYRCANTLIAHSNWAKLEIARLFPEAERKVIVAWHGLYTIYSRVPQTRKGTREALKIPHNNPTLLLFGGIRPYKNIDALLTAMQRPELAESVLIVAGVESGFNDCIPGDQLGRTRCLAHKLGIANRIRLLPGPLHLRQTAEIMEASDILVLPYLKSYGSGLLLLGMTFGKFIAATRTGGIEEYVRRYPRHTLLNGTTPFDIAEGLALAIRHLKESPECKVDVIPELTWVNIARNVLTKLGDF